MGKARRVPAWKAEARALSEAVPYVRAQRIRRTLRRRALETPGHLRWHWSLMCAFAAGAALVLLMLRPMFSAPTSPETPVVVTAPAAPTEVSPPAAPRPPAQSIPVRSLALALAGQPCEAGPGDIASAAGLKLGPECVITGVGVVLRSEGDLWIRGDAQEVELRRGRMNVHVDPEVARERPFVIETPALRIEVTGTRFTVSHSDPGGALELWEGSVRVTQRDQTWWVSAGQRLQWSARGSAWLVEPADVPEKKRGKSSRTPAVRNAPASPPKIDHADRLVRELEQLRERGKSSEAVALLEEGLPKLERRDREILSFELGKLLERARGSKAACLHWAAYQESFPKGRYADLVEAEVSRLKCSSS